MAQFRGQKSDFINFEKKRLRKNMSSDKVRNKKLAQELTRLDESNSTTLRQLSPEGE